MKVVIDALCAEYGGIRTYVEQLVGGWSARYPDDEVHVVLRAGSTIETPGLVRHEMGIGSPDVLARPWAQATRLHRLVDRIRPDIVLATAPTTDPRPLPVPLAVVILDLRAELRPEQFSRARRLLRFVSYRRSYALARGFISISGRSLADLRALHPRTAAKHGVVAHLGSDHVETWPSPTRSGPAIAFGHHSNKNPDLVVDAWAELMREGSEVPALMVLGVSGALRDQLQQQIKSLGVADRVHLAPFLDDDAFKQTIAAASMVVFPSDFEGFGLPIVEGMALGKPVVIAPDPGMLEVAGGHAVVAEDWTATAVADAVRRAVALDDAALDGARAWADGFTWSRTIDTTRSALMQMTVLREKAE